MTVNLHHVVLTVSDIEASAAWYTDLFGFAELAREEHFGGSGGRTILLGAPDWSMGVGLSSHPTNGGETFDPTRTGLDHVGFTVANRAALEEWEAKLADKGVKHSPISDHEWGSALNFRDPDDMQLQLIAFA
jgi:glyoxylase I family protein